MGTNEETVATGDVGVIEVRISEALVHICRQFGAEEVKWSLAGERREVHAQPCYA